jgi:hypothetical protein
MNTTTCAMMWTCRVTYFKSVFGSNIFVTFGVTTFEEEGENFKLSVW